MQRISSDNVIYKFTNDLKEVQKVKQNEEFIVETNDCFYQQIKNEDKVLDEINHDNLNPATGKYRVEPSIISAVSMFPPCL